MANNETGKPECTCGNVSLHPDCPRHGIESEWYKQRRAKADAIRAPRDVFEALTRISIGIYGRKESGLREGESDENGMAKADWQLAQDALERFGGEKS